MVLKISFQFRNSLGILTCHFLFWVLAVSHCLSQENAPAKDLSGSTADKPIHLENALLKPFDTIKVASQVEGRIAKLLVKEGEWVTENQQVGMIDDHAVQLQHVRAQIATSMAKLKLNSKLEMQLALAKSEVAKNELDRAVSANSRVSDTYPLKEIERLRLVYESAKLDVERAGEEKELQRLELRKFENEQAITEELIGRHKIVTPVTGMVVSVSRHTSEWTQPGVDILQIVQLDRLKVEGFIAATGLSELAERKAIISISHDGKEVRASGVVAFAYPEVNSLTNQMRVVLEIDNQQKKFVPGCRVRAAILPKNQP